VDCTSYYARKLRDIKGNVKNKQLTYILIYCEIAI
jgi:hypothetical protein